IRAEGLPVLQNTYPVLIARDRPEARSVRLFSPSERALDAELAPQRMSIPFGEERGVGELGRCVHRVTSQISPNTRSGRATSTPVTGVCEIQRRSRCCRPVRRYWGHQRSSEAEARAAPSAFVASTRGGSRPESHRNATSRIGCVPHWSGAVGRRSR